MLLGYENKYINIYHIHKDFQKKLPQLSEMNEIVLNIIRERINNLKHLLIRIKSIIYNIINSNKNTSNYNLEELNIINTFYNKIKTIEISKNKNKIFNKHIYILNNLHLDYNLPDNLNYNLNLNYYDITNLYFINNNDSLILFYIIYNFNKLLEYNNDKTKIYNISLLIIYIIKFSFNFYYKKYYDYNIRQFDFIILNENPYVNDIVKSVGDYNELMDKQEIEEYNKDKYDIHEEFNALDIDDYDKDDDYDGDMEAFGDVAYVD
jgi:hypothetical protein